MYFYFEGGIYSLKAGMNVALGGFRFSYYYSQFSPSVLIFLEIRNKRHINTHFVSWTGSACPEFISFMVQTALKYKEVLLNNSLLGLRYIAVVA